MLAVAGGKGGCGKTTTTACLARALSAAGRAPLVVDADVDMPDLHHVVGASPNPGLDAVADGVPVEEVAQSPVDLPGVRLIACGSEPPSTPEPALDRLRAADAPVLVDTAAGASPAVTDPLRAADRTLIVSTTTRQSLEDAAKTAAVARALDAPVVGTVLTHCDGPTDPRALLDCPTLARVPPVNDPLRDERVRESYAALVRELIERNV